MQELKCKICGGSLTVDHKSKIAVCNYCGTKQILPLFSDESAMLLYERGGKLLQKGEYDKAESIFYQLLPLCPEDPEIYWDLVLCKYGVQYVKDPQSGKYLPTCNRTHYSSILNDENYKKALEYASTEQSKIYEADAQYINDVQKKIISIAKKEKPFDIFISYKETDSSGARTEDSIQAQEIYRKLTEQGYKVFFSRITLESKAGTEYEPYIYAALSSSKVMLTVCSSKENIESAWVKNEWSRFLTLRQKDSSKTLIPVYFDMQKSDLPLEFENIPSYDMLSNGFEQELFRGIKKLIPLPIMLAQKRKKRRKRLGITALIFIVVLLIAGIFSIPYIKDYINTNKVYEEVMQLYYDGNYPEAAWGFRDLGDFKDSEEMQAKCELSWRNSLASIAVDNNLSGATAGSYYVTPNGTVETFNYDAGTANENLNINEHGKIVSISDHDPLYALHEDGYVDNVAENNNLSDTSEWHDIIQISPVFNFHTNVALRADGKLLYGSLIRSYDDEETDEWLSDISRWEHIISFDYSYSRFGAGGLVEAAFAAVDSDGLVHIVTYDSEDSEIRGIETVEKFQNVKKIDIEISTDYSKTEQDIVKYLNAVAITTDGKIISSINGDYSEYDTSDIVDVELGVEYDDNLNSQYYVCELHSDGTLCKKDSNKYMLSDVVYLNDGFVVTRSGSIYGGNYKNYKNGSDELGSTEGKTKVHDEWIERFN